MIDNVMNVIKPIIAFLGSIIVMLDDVHKMEQNKSPLWKKVTI